ncbi:MAG TPA: 4-alpha-glucanotransferase, partial [Desulfopila sp.]|nr:4-alpha-glucanotransferase [Desulfopila sp.]
MDESVRCSRSSGILAHITSLPSPYGIGDMGSGTANFLQFLARSGQSILQILPLGPTHPAFSNSPYMTVSAFAGNPLIISPELLREEGLLSANELKEILK